MSMHDCPIETVVATTSNWPSGQHPLGLRDRLGYFTHRLKDNFGLASALCGSVSSVSMELRPWTSMERELCLTASPSRLYVDAFWRSLPWTRIASTLGEVTILELGCGSGSMSKLFVQVLGESLVRYVEIDIQPRDGWDDLKRFDPRIQFTEAAAEDLPKELLSNANLIVSQSTLEHIEGDLTFFMAHHACLSLQWPVIQIHAVPAEASLFLYLVHGYRQYSRRSISYIAAVYPEARCGLVRLGGIRSNLLHFVTITLPGLLRIESLRDMRSEWYASLLRACYDRERLLNSCCPAFYGIILESGLEQSLFAWKQDGTQFLLMMLAHFHRWSESKKIRVGSGLCSRAKNEPANLVCGQGEQNTDEK